MLSINLYISNRKYIGNGRHKNIIWKFILLLNHIIAFSAGAFSQFITILCIVGITTQ